MKLKCLLKLSLDPLIIQNYIKTNETFTSEVSCHHFFSHIHETRSVCPKYFPLNNLTIMISIMASSSLTIIHPASVCAQIQTNNQGFFSPHPPALYSKMNLVMFTAPTSTECHPNHMVRKSQSSPLITGTTKAEVCQGEYYVQHGQLVSPSPLFPLTSLQIVLPLLFNKRYGYVIGSILQYVDVRWGNAGQKKWEMLEDWRP